MSYTISEAARRMGVAPSTLRYYDKEGLLPNLKRKNGQRVFDENDLRLLTLLSCLKNTGMPLKQIRKYVDMVQKGDKTIPERYELIKEQRQFILDQMEQLKYYLSELDFKDWFYRTAIKKGTTKGISLEDYERETGNRTPEMDVLEKD
ncbi:MerR family transcriptional regulator [uncultured Dialister sp.]|jgi:DNA-binding transcriptional MerR regulator|uniref:MerR family transcriptional regulator n=1 Tax=uncultured Dialister sp. TaxID=278064 RepID=UPI0025D9339A|nr:MerR family transcriptional regulator [uncultured Dialister sp.]